MCYQCGLMVGAWPLNAPRISWSIEGAAIREILLAIHVVSAAAWIGGVFTLLVLLPRMRAMGHESGASMVKNMGAMSNSYFRWFPLLVLISGVWLVLEGSFAFEHVFVILGIGVVVFAFGVGPRVLKPTGMGIVGAHSATDEGPLPGLYQKLQRTLGLIAVLLVTVVIAMLDKWGA